MGKLLLWLVILVYSHRGALVSRHPICALEPLMTMTALNYSTLLLDRKLSFIQALVLLERRGSCKLAVTVTARHVTRRKSRQGIELSRQHMLSRAGLITIVSTAQSTQLLQVQTNAISLSLVRSTRRLSGVE